MPDLLVALVKRLVRWGVLPARMAPDTAIINIYDKVTHQTLNACGRNFASARVAPDTAVINIHNKLPPSMHPLHPSLCIRQAGNEYCYH